MPASLTISLETLYGFLLVLARVGGAFIFVPIPGIKAAGEPARVGLAAGIALALFARWPHIDAAAVRPGAMAAALLGEAALGIAIGVSIAIVLEALPLAAQILGIQAGYAYASTIDPNTEADSGILLVFAQMMGFLLFFALGLDRDVLRVFADSLERMPPGAVAFGPQAAEPLVRLGGVLLTVALRMAMPVIALLILVDVALALLGRLNSQLQLLSVAFPLKMMVALLVLSWVAGLFPRVLSDFSAAVWPALRQAGI